MLLRLNDFVNACKPLSRKLVAMHIGAVKDKILGRIVNTALIKKRQSSRSCLALTSSLVITTRIGYCSPSASSRCAFCVSMQPLTITACPSRLKDFLISSIPAIPCTGSKMFSYFLYSTIFISSIKFIHRTGNTLCHDTGNRFAGSLIGIPQCIV